MAKKRVAVDDLRASVVDRQDIRLVDTYVRPQAAQQDTTMRELASFLEKASSQVAYIGRQKKDADIKVATTAAQEFAYASKEMVTFAEARESGQLDIMDDPTVELAFNKAMGIRFGRELASDLQNRLESEREAILEMDGEKFDEHFDKLSTELMDGLDKNWITQPGIRLGLLSHLSGVKNNAKQQHIAGARARKDEKLQDAFIVGMNAATENVPLDQLATAINSKQAELLGSESAYTGTQINKYMTTWLSNKIKTTEDIRELNGIMDSVKEIKAGSGALGGTGVWQEASQALVRQASDRIQTLNNKKHSDTARQRTELIAKVEDQMVEFYNNNGNLDAFDLADEDKLGILNNTDVLQLKKTITNLLKKDEGEDFTLAQAEQMYAYFGGMSETQALEVVDDIKRGENDDIQITSLQQWRALETIARNAVQSAGDPYTDRTYRELETRINDGFKAIPDGIGGVIVDGQNREAYDSAVADLRQTWIEIKTNPEAISMFIPEEFAGLRGQPWRVISQNALAVRAIRDKVLGIVESRHAYPATTEGSLTTGGAREIDIGDGDTVLETTTE